MYQRVRQIAIDSTARLPFGLGDFIMQSEFTRNVIKLSSGTALVTMLSFLITPLNTRLFSPEDYGLANLIVSVSGMFGVILSFNLNPVILMEKYRKVAETTATLSFILLGISLLIVGGLLFGFADLILPLLKAEAIKPWLPLAFIMMIIGGVGSILTQLIQRQKLYGLISKAGIISNLVGHAIRLPWGYFAPSFYALYLSNVIAGIVNFAVWIPRAAFSPVWNIKRLSCIFRKNLSFMIYRSIVAILGAVTNQLPIFWIAANCGMAEVGYYGMAVLLIDTPFGLLLNSFQTVYYKRVADTVAHEPQKLMSLYWRNTWKLCLLGLIPIVIIAAASPFIPFLLSEKWAPAVPILQLLLFWRLQSFVVVPMSSIIVILRRNGYSVFNAALSLVLVTGIIYISENSILSFLGYCAIAGYTLSLMMMVWTVYIIRDFNRKRNKG